MREFHLPVWLGAAGRPAAIDDEGAADNQIVGQATILQ